MSLTVFALGIFLGLSSPSNAEGDHGGDHSGGGTIVIRTLGSDPILLDLLERSPQLKETHVYSKPLEVSPYIQAMGAAFIDLEKLPIYAQLQKRLDSWYRFAPGLVTLIQDAFRNVGFRATVFRLKPIEQYHLGQELLTQFPQLSIQAAITYYHVATLPYTPPAATISIPVWNALGDQSQLGLLIHEALRYEQIKKGLSLSNARLQILTAKLVLQEPSASVDFSDAITGTLKTKIQKIDRYVETNKKLVPLMCSKMKEILIRYPFTINDFNHQSLAENTRLVCSEAKNADSFAFGFEIENRIFEASHLSMPETILLKDIPLFEALTDFDLQLIQNFSIVSKDEDLQDIQIDGKFHGGTAYRFWIGYESDEHDHAKRIRWMLEGQENLVPPNERENAMRVIEKMRAYIRSLQNAGLLIDGSFECPYEQFFSELSVESLIKK